MVEYQRDFLTIHNVDDVESFYLQNLIAARDGVIDDKLRDLMRLEKYMRGVRPYGAQMIIRMLLSGLAHKYPVETEIMHRELESGRACDPAHLDETERLTPESLKEFDVWISLRGRDWVKARCG